MMLFPDNWFSEICPLIDDRGFTIVGSISQAHRIPKSQDPNKLILYNWDVYPWMNYKDGPWQRWGELLKSCRDIWHTSEACARRTEEMYGIKKGQVIKTFVPVDQFAGPVGNNNYVLMPMRHYVQDKCFGWAQKACDELEIDLIHPNHNIDKKAYEKIMRYASVILSHYYEASTGGLGIIEGMSLGKPVLINAMSGYNGGKEYAGDYGWYFKTYEEMKKLLVVLMAAPHPIHGQQEFTKNYDIKIMAEKINEALHSYK